MAGVWQGSRRTRRSILLLDWNFASLSPDRGCSLRAEGLTSSSFPAGCPFFKVELNWHWCLGRSVVSDSLQPHGLWPAGLLCPGDSPGRNTRMGCHALLQGIFPTQGSILNLLHWQADSFPLTTLGSWLSLVHSVLGPLLFQQFLFTHT